MTSHIGDLLDAIDPKGCLKVFIMILLLGTVFFIFWILIRPDTSRKIGVLPFPTTGPYVPFDSSQCGRDIINCSTDGQSKCDQSCQNTPQNPNYRCTNIPKDKEVWYLGTKLQSPNGDQSYCLPSQNIDTMSSCGTYTGKALWNQTHWVCQCKYPSLFNGDDCMIQQACRLEKGQKLPTGSATTGLLIRADGKIWDPNNPQGIESSDNPLDWASDGTPLYQCDCSSNGTTYRKSGDPYRCHSDLCYGGEASTTPTTAQFNPDSGTCQCDNLTTVKSNITGFCYPIETAVGETACDPDLLTGNCSCGNHWIDNSSSNSKCATGPKGFFFRHNSDLYLTWQDPSDQQVGGKCQRDLQSGNLIQPLHCPIYKVLINNSTATDDNGKLIIQRLNDLLADSWETTPIPNIPGKYCCDNFTRYTGYNIAGTMVEFQLMQYPTRSDVNVNSPDFQTYIKNSFNCGFSGDAIEMVHRMTSPVINNSLSIPCNSFFYDRTNDTLCPEGGCVKCNDPYYASSDLNNKNGTFCFQPASEQQCGGFGTAYLNLFDKAGYNCSCNNDDRSYLADTTLTTPSGSWTQHTCLQTQIGTDHTCSHDYECMPLHHCNSSCGWSVLCNSSCGGGF